MDRSAAICCIIIVVGLSYRRCVDSSQNSTSSKFGSGVRTFCNPLDENAKRSSRSSRNSKPYFAAIVLIGPRHCSPGDYKDRMDGVDLIFYLINFTRRPFLGSLFITSRHPFKRGFQWIVVICQERVICGDLDAIVVLSGTEACQRIARMICIRMPADLKLIDVSIRRIQLTSEVCPLIHPCQPDSTTGCIE